MRQNIWAFGSQLMQMMLPVLLVNLCHFICFLSKQTNNYPTSFYRGVIFSDPPPPPRPTRPE